MYIAYSGIKCECPECGAKVSEKNAGMTILWANGHGVKIRIFCHECGKWSDRTMLYKSGKETIKTFTPAIPHMEYQERVFKATQGAL